MWYATDSYDERPVQVSFSLATKARCADYHETRLLDRFDDLAGLDQGIEWGLRDAVWLDGCVSLVFRGEECFGSDYWVEFHRATNLWRLVCLGEPDDQPIGQSAGQRALWFTNESRGTLVELKLPQKTTRSWVMPTGELVREWVLMMARVRRLRAELGDPECLGFVDDPVSYFRCEAHRQFGLPSV